MLCGAGDGIRGAQEYSGRGDVDEGQAVEVAYIRERHLHGGARGLLLKGGFSAARTTGGRSRSCGIILSEMPWRV